MFPRRGQQSGFTLIETLVAGMILALSLAVMGTALSHSYSALGDARDERRAAILIEDLLTKIDMIGPSRIADEGPRDGRFDGDDSRFSWTVDVANRPEGHLYQVTVKLSWSSREGTKSAQIQTYLNDPPNSHDATLKWRDL